MAQRTLAALKARAASLQGSAPVVEPEPVAEPEPIAEPPQEPQTSDAKALASPPEETLLAPEPSRPIATPARGIVNVGRPVSSDAQPTEQQLWDQEFTGQLAAPNDEDDDQYVFEADPDSRLHNYVREPHLCNLMIPSKDDNELLQMLQSSMGSAQDPSDEASISPTVPWSLA